MGSVARAGARNSDSRRAVWSTLLTFEAFSAVSVAAAVGAWAAFKAARLVTLEVATVGRSVGGGSRAWRQRARQGFVGLAAASSMCRGRWVHLFWGSRLFQFVVGRWRFRACGGAAQFLRKNKYVTKGDVEHHLLIFCFLKWQRCIVAALRSACAAGTWCRSRWRDPLDCV